MFRRVFTALCCGLTAVLLWFAPVIAQDAPRNVVTVGFNELPPYSFTDAMGRVQGYSVDLLRHLAQHAGIEVAFESFANPKEVLQALDSGHIDVTSLLIITDAREQIGRFANPVGEFEQAAFVLRGSGLESTGDLAGRRIGATIGSYSATAAEQIPFAEIVGIETRNDLIFALLDGSIDALVAPTEMFREDLQRLNLSSVVEQSGPALTTMPGSFLVNTADAQLLARLNAAIDQELTNDFMSNLSEKWFYHESEQFTQVNSVLTILMLLVLVVLALLIKRRNYNGNQPFTNDQNNKLLIEALNKIDLCIVIYDETLRTVHWNEATSFTFPTLVPQLRRGARMKDLISYSYQVGITSHRKTEKSARAFADQIIDDLSQGKDTTRLVSMSDGRIFEAVEFAFGSNLYASLRKDVTKDQLQAQKIHDQNVKLAVANERMQHFSEMAAHDLRAPLHHQITLLDFITEDLKDADVTIPAEVSEYIDMSKASLDRMLRLVEDLLEYARSDVGAASASTVDLGQRFDDVLELILIPDGFSVSRAPELPLIKAAKTAVDIVLRNLISNAIKHHDKATGTIHVSCQTTGTWVHILIEDDGPGIPDEHKTRIFKPFEQLNVDTAVMGSGLGLAMVARTVEGWGGQISVEDRPNGGSVFRVSAPAPTTDSVITEPGPYEIAKTATS